jgi:hypothetical protein
MAVASIPLPRRHGHTWQWLLLVLLAIVVLAAIIAAFFIEEPLRRRIESAMNANLSDKGYVVRIAKLDFHPLGFSLDLENWTVSQRDHPDPPLADVPNLTASVMWHELLRLKLVANFRMDNPRLHLDQAQGERELANPTPVDERARGWQQAFQEIYPLKINEFRINDGHVVFKPDGKFKPLELSDVNILATNIRNIRSRDRQYPSDLHADAVVFENGSLRIDGNADFLAEPYAGVKAEIELGKLPLPYLSGVLHEYAAIRKGTLSGKGLVEYAPKIKQVNLIDVNVAGADIDYILTAANKGETKQMKAKTVQTAKDVSNDPGVQLRAENVRVSDSTVGYVNRTGDPDYRLFLSDLDVTVKNFSNQKSEGIGTIDAKGKFLGTGPSTLNAKFHPETKSPNFDLAVRINEADLTKMNDLLKAKGNVDVTSGFMGFYSELGVRNNAVDGYVKVLFHDVDVYDPKQDKHKPILNKAYEMAADAVSKILENRKTDDVATKASLSGPIENPNASIMEILTRLLQNAFVQAILPGLDQSRKD